MNTTKAVNVIFFLLLAATFSSCKSQKLASDTLIISIEKTPCFGTCEAYKLDIYASGLVKFTGISNHQMIGKYQSTIEKLSLQEIRNKFREANFFSFKNEYTSKMSDLPTIYLYFKDGAVEKKIQDYYGAPLKLKELEKLIEDLVVALKWKKED
jgi:Domain of unknown function (DUF6438)